MTNGELFQQIHDRCRSADVGYTLTLSPATGLFDFYVHSQAPSEEFFMQDVSLDWILREVEKRLVEG